MSDKGRSALQYAFFTAMFMLGWLLMFVTLWVITGGE